MTIKNWYSLTLINEILNYLCHAKIYTKLDIIALFNQLYIQESAKTFTTFWMYFSLFEYVVMFFGLCNSLTSFQYYINNILKKYLNIFYTIYLNNILIYDKNKLEYKIHIKKVLCPLWDIELQVDIIKFQFYIIEIAYFSLIVNIKKV